MRPTKPKEIPRYILEFLPFSVKLGLALLYDGKVYSSSDVTCPRCGGRHVWRAGYRGKTFVRLITKDGLTEVRVRVQRYMCGRCGKMWLDQGPFYPGTDIGAPVVDLVLALSMDNSSYGVERIMASMGIQVSSDVVLNYIRTFADRAREKAPL